MLDKLLSPKKKLKSKYGWFGDYSSWVKANAGEVGYDKDMVLERSADALLKVKSVEAVYERGSVVFDKRHVPYALMSFLMLSASLKKKPLNILDYGGSLGSTYFLLKDFLTADICSSWNIIEQAHLVACGKAKFEDEALRYYNSIDNCLAENEVDFALLSDSVQYLKDPHVFLQKLSQYDFDFILFDRTTFNYATNDRLTLRIVPPEIYPASYPAWFFHEDFFLSHFSARYKVVAEFPSYVKEEAVVLIDGKPQGINKGFYLINMARYD